jgi:hypothetical protein
MDELTAICLLIAVPALIEIAGGTLIALLLVAAYWSDIRRDSK